jgi:cytochrome c-type biogenesis protein
MIELVIFSFFAGVLTVLAPCILPLIPVVIGASTDTSGDTKSSLRKPVVIIISLIVSIAIFTLLLRSTTALLGVPSSVWSVISGIIIILFGVNMFFPALWEKLLLITGLHLVANKNMARAQSSSGIKRDILLGASLGPVFNSCSPTYALIVAVLLPASFASGLLYLFAYCIGLGAILLLLALFGRALITKIRWMSNPNGLFQKLIGALFIVVGLVVSLGIDKSIQTIVLDNGWYEPIESIEKSFMSN